jgi:hypothetical protein
MDGRQHHHYITPQELAVRLRGKVKPKTLANWRAAGRGPKWTKFGRSILYALPDVLAWERARSASGRSATPTVSRVGMIR